MCRAIDLSARKACSRVNQKTIHAGVQHDELNARYDYNLFYLEDNMASFDRIDRISQECHKAIDRIIRDELNDPRIGGTWSIVRCEVTRDLRYCKVRVSILEEDKRKDMMAALKKAAGFVRRELGRNVDLRYVPEVQFELDTNIEYAAHINQLLKETQRHDEARDD